MVKCGCGCELLVIPGEGVLMHRMRVLSTREADQAAREHGFVYAEQLVKWLEKGERDEVVAGGA